MGAEILGILMVGMAIAYSFYKKNDKLGVALIIVLLMLLYLLGYLGVKP